MGPSGTVGWKPLVHVAWVKDFPKLIAENGQP